MSNRVSVCSCGEPLVYTFAFSGAEYFCVKDGRKYGMMDAPRENETPELEHKLKLNEKKFAKVRKGLLSGGAMLRDCDVCSQTSEPHLHHATDLEKKAHQAAITKINRMVGNL